VGAAEDILAALKRLEAKVDKLIATQPLNAASDRELDGRYGDGKIKFTPKNYNGPDYKGALMSVCPSELLEAYAEALRYMADHPKAGTDPKYIDYNRKDAALALGWARRNHGKMTARAPVAAPQPPSAPHDGEDVPWGDDGPDIPF
jgi:hypothetical protein